MSVLSDIGGIITSPFGWASDAFPALDQTSTAAIGGILVLVTIVALGSVFVPQDPMAGRLRSHMRRRDRLRTERLQMRPRTQARRVQVGWLRPLLDPLKLLSGDEAKRSSDLLARAGWRSRAALPVFMACRAVLPI